MAQVIMLLQWCQELQKVIMLNPWLCLFLLLPLLFLLRVAKREKLNLPPSPPKLPMIGNLHQLGRLPHRSLRALSAKYGPLMLLHFGKTPTLIVSSAEVAREVMKTHDVAFSGRPQTRAADVFFYGCVDVAFCPYGEYWRQAKKICVLEILSQKRVQAFQFVREEEVTNMVEKVRLSCLNGAAVDLSDTFLTVSNNIISRSTLGRVYVNEGSDENFGGLSRKVIDLLASFCFKDTFHFLGWMDTLTGLVAGLKNTSRALHDFLDKVIEEHESLMNNDESHMKDMVDILLDLQKNGALGIDLTRENIKAILMDMFVGGTDTTAAAMEWTMAELVKNPTVMKKAQGEVRRVAGEKSKLCEKLINEMVYLKCVVKESLRLHAPTMIARETCEAVKLEGYDIPPRTRVLINTWAIQRDPKQWEKSEEFIPERFANISVDFKGQHNQFMPFGGGRRACPGLSFAVKEAEIVIANLLYWFDWNTLHGDNPEDLDLAESFTLIIRKKTPLVLVPVMPPP
ncbi:hypothetical protein OIU76_022271 [Salix suchowensis]|nr:hypothetical protein OIU76_022271 [Salix suchowensis]